MLIVLTTVLIVSTVSMALAPKAQPVRIKARRDNQTGRETGR